MAYYLLIVFTFIHLHVVFDTIMTENYQIIHGFLLHYRLYCSGTLKDRSYTCQ